MINLVVHRTMRRFVGIPITPELEDHPCRLFATACCVYARVPIKFSGPKGKYEKNIEINLTEICCGLCCVYRYIHTKSPSYVWFLFCERHIYACKVLVITTETTVTARQDASSFLYRSAATTRTSVSSTLLSLCKNSTDIVLILISHFLECLCLNRTLKKNVI
jgi:hypothetical protein